ncbi:hypothetical protein Tco_0356956 [Tanacetum coccineum]
MEKLSSLLARLDIQLLPLNWQDSSGDELLNFVKKVFNLLDLLIKIFCSAFLDQEELNMTTTSLVELLADYDCEIRYHPGKENVVADALSRKERSKPL